MIRPTDGTSDESGPVRTPGAGHPDNGRPGLGQPGIGRAVALLLLVASAALIPLLGPSIALDGTGEAAAPGVGGIALLRTVLFAALCVPVGELFVRRLAGRLPGAPPERARSWAPYAAGAGFVAALGLASVVSTGNLVPHSLAAIDVGGLYESRDGKLALLEVNGFAAAGLCALSARPAMQVWPLCAVAVAEALRAHPAPETGPLTGSALTFVHLTCAALWVGGLLYVLRTLPLWGAARDARVALLGLYARVAAPLLALITATGIWSTLRRMPPGTVLDQLTSTAYGRTLLAKVIVVVAVAVLALWSRLRLSRAADPLTACAPARAEVVALGLVVAVSGLLTALPVPIRWT
nr:CopD family protein [Streptomyces sp. SID12488]